MHLLQFRLIVNPETFDLFFVITLLFESLDEASVSSERRGSSVETGIVDLIPFWIAEEEETSGDRIELLDLRPRLVEGFSDESRSNKIERDEVILPRSIL